MSKLAFPKPRKKKPRPRRFGSSLPVGQKKPSKPRKPLAKVNPEREAKRRKRYAAKLAKYRASETYTVVEQRAAGRCEFVIAADPRSLTQFEAFRCPDGGREHHHKTYARFGGKELPTDIIVLCAFHHDKAEAEHPTRKRGSFRQSHVAVHPKQEISQ